MCRHIAWLGAERSLAELLVAPPFGLLRQSWEPRRQRHGRFNADGFGVGWYAPTIRPEPARYRRAVPMWTDASFASFAGVTRSGCVLAAVRDATVGMPIEESATAPFTDGELLLSHNGRVVDTTVLTSLLAGRPDAPVPDSRCDSALLAALVWERTRAGVGLAEAVAEVVTTVGAKAAARAAASEAGAAGDVAPTRLNVLVTDGRRIVATTWNETLWYRLGPAGVLVASEPGDDAPTTSATPVAPTPGRASGGGAPAVDSPAQSGDEPEDTPGPDVWVEVPNHHLLTADTHKITLSNLISEDGYPVSIN
ncbi:ergothioneine biosynthesis protein EgtC [Frankia sp. CNm7]|uniref:Gamma-glutamyl-hercynylcysteine sulfoxide hydrolase n=1 Tax=Frankia nepalensis TaxID=1836974 RepID=A0A937US14_9ACTN|nr:ergothioneine biosynthesis protein EgtC [Frankia nepalensis]MBL7496773.1 ergothioneine biosynthesis protein EgtC [Frankia nepalensis]MBL7516171.1 ergothioneine biosynthesis protein EgtC [Frankia nepalensis]MBL7521995.1 ergothioneine biosynthesis protein EgtC [Frankia nepalensis]MBL7633404.1 ergothioneine biosynthesis protein EgtC [Frankia nepalensis]